MRCDMSPQQLLLAKKIAEGYKATLINDYRRLDVPFSGWPESRKLNTRLDIEAVDDLLKAYDWAIKQLDIIGE